MNLKVAIGLSGGVDSAVSAYMLREAGYDVMGIILRLKDGDSTERDIADAQAVADFLGIELHVLDRREVFRAGIIGDFTSEYLNGRTPNPCIECNKLIKFGTMLDYALEKGCDKIATGHYADITEENDRFFLKKTDSPKDQSYFLFRLSQAQLSKIIFPLRGMEKTDTRALALEKGIPVAGRKDSLEICFVPDDDYISYLASVGITAPEGNFIGTDGSILGRHSGIINYTVGQRKGLGAYGKPMFVNSIDAVNNTVTIGENGTQYSGGLIADRTNFIAFDSLEEPIRAKVRIRYRAKEQPALIIPCPGGFEVKFDEPQRSVTPGQSAVIYDGDTVIGGGRIIKQIP